MFTPVLASMPDAVMILNRERQIIYGNKVVQDYALARHTPYLGLRPGELFGCQQVKKAPGGCGTGEGCRTCGALAAILDGLAGKTARTECHISLIENEAMDLRVYASPFLWQGNVYVLLVATDISDQNRRKILERIFFHDILNTAGGIQGLAEIIFDDHESVEELSPMLRTSARGLVHEIKSQRQLLAAENHSLEVTPSTISSLNQIQSVIGLYQHHEVSEGRRIVIDPETTDCSLVSDEAILQRVLGNLLKNALEASQAGGTVTIGTRPGEKGCIFWCQNDGCIPHDEQLQIFRRNFTTKGAGRGVGTYSVKLLVDQYLAGEVSFTSTEANGTKFQVIVPLSLVSSS
jgi:signal transduction histidine kinase